MKVSIEEIMEITERRWEINRIPLDELELTENGELIDTPQWIKDKFDFTGLGNIDFVTSGYFRKDYHKNIPGIEDLE